jgi:predicted Zn-dependent peptidase
LGALANPQDTEHALEILADILQNSLLPKRQIESERSVILREMEACQRHWHASGTSGLRCTSWTAVLHWG